MRSPIPRGAAADAETADTIAAAETEDRREITDKGLDKNMDRYLIINADDFGMCHSGNLAVMDLLQKGGITSSTIMAPCAWAYEAVKFANAHPEYAIGVHLTTTSEWGTYRWASVSGGASLHDDKGFMWDDSDVFEENADLDEAEAEIRAQYKKLTDWGFKPSHFDNHMGSLYGIETGRLEMLNMTFDTLAEYGLPFRFPANFLPEQLGNEMLDIKIDPQMLMNLFGTFVSYAKDRGIVMPDYLIPGDGAGPQKESYENYREYIYELYKTFPEGVTETYIHPALESDELKAITSRWKYRVWEYQLFSDPKTKQHIDSLGIKLINYRDLAAMKK